MEKASGRILIAAPKSGSGKTTITCALLQALKDAGLEPAACKCGPDYIDPMFHRQVLGVPSGNLDTFFTGAEETLRLYREAYAPEQLVVMEGVMGLFDGLGGIREEGSAYHLAQVTRTPIVLVVDAKGMGRSVLALVAGFLQYDTDHLIRGVILNRMSGAYAEILRPLFERELGIPLLGYFPVKPELQVESRHLGLYLPEELDGIRARLDAAAVQLRETVEVEQIIAIAESAPALEVMAEEMPKMPATVNVTQGVKRLFADTDRPRIAVARDAAFCFYYEENLRLLRQLGAELVPFSPLTDAELPEDCDGLLLGGGYPELYAAQLSANTAMLEAVRAAIRAGLPTVAECGGFLYLHETLEDPDGAAYTMAGVLPGRCYYTGHLVRFGYIELEESETHFLPAGSRIRGHEFHYYDSTDNGADVTAVKPTTGRKYSCIHAGENYWYGFPHLYYPSCPGFAEHFVKQAERYRRNKEVVKIEENT